MPERDDKKDKSKSMLFLGLGGDGDMSLKKSQSVRDLVKKFSAPAVILKLRDLFNVVGDYAVTIKWGIHAKTLAILGEFSKEGVVSANRAKPIAFVTEKGEVISVLNARHDASSPKPTTVAVKTSSPLSHKEGHPVIDVSSLDLKSLRLLNRQPKEKPDSKAKDFSPDQSDEVYGVKSKDSKNEMFVTFERQDLSFILSQIRSFKTVTDKQQEIILPGKYKVIACEAPDAKHFGSVVMEDVEGVRFMITLGPDKEFKPHTGLKPSVGMLIRSFSFRESKTDKKTTEDDSYWAQIIPDQHTRNNFKKLINSEKFKENSNNTVRLLPCHFDKENKRWIADEIPDVASDRHGRPIVGDIDVQQDFITNLVPPQWGAKYVRYEHEVGKDKNDPITDLIKQFKEMKTYLVEKLEFDKHNKTIITSIENAIVRLQKFSETNPGDFSILSEMGNISIIRAALVLGSNSTILHGNESGSPLFPETIVMVDTIDPITQKDHILTYSEFEYLKLLQLNEALMQDKLTAFNPCWLVADEHKMWRQPMVVDGSNRRVPAMYTIDNNGKRHACNNGDPEVEKLNIKLWRLALEKHLLQYMLHSLETNKSSYDEYVAITKSNYKDIYNHVKYKDGDGRKLLLRETLFKGQAVFESIDKNVRQMDAASAKARLTVLSDLPSKGITSDDDLKKWVNANYIDYADTAPSAAPGQGAKNP